MEFFEKPRLKIGNILLRKKLEKTKRKVFYSNISLVRKIGIVWDASQFNDFPSLSKFYQKMNERKIEVKIIGYFPGQNLPDQYTAIRFLTCVRRDEVNFFYHPVSTDSRTFLDSPFDILIDINFENLLPLKYLSSLSNAAFKVGLFDPETKDPAFDLMIELKKPVVVENYLAQTLQYLEMIKAD